MSSSSEYRSYFAEYCEWCGDLVDGSDELVEAMEAPVSRTDILETIAEVDEDDPDPFTEVGETVATEEGECDCGGQLVKRYYTAGDVPEPEYLPDDDAEFAGRDPDEDALFFDEVGVFAPEDSVVDMNDMPGGGE